MAPERKEKHVSSGNVGNEELGTEPLVSSTKIGGCVLVSVQLARSGQDPAPRSLSTYSLDDLIQRVSVSRETVVLSDDEVNELMRNVIAKLQGQHRSGIHGDFRPQNVFITVVPCLSAKLSDMGIIHQDASNHPTDPKNSGWQACEQICGEPPSCATDILCVGIVWFMLHSRGKHPFGGDPLERKENFRLGKMELLPVVREREVDYLFWCMLNHDSQLRPKAQELLSWFWDPVKKGRFFVRFSERLHNKPNKKLIYELQCNGDRLADGNWTKLIDRKYMERKYDDTVKELMQLIRNSFSHPFGRKEFEGFSGGDDGSIYSYFADKFPNLWLKSYRAASRCCRKEAWFKEFHPEERIDFFGHFPR